MNLPHGLLNRPLALWDGHVPFVSARGGPAAYAERFSIPDAPASETVGTIAVVPVRGVLSNARDWWFCGSSYAGITNDILTALQDDGVKAIALHVDSPGGEVAGCAEVAELVFSHRGTKPIVAICDATACSAAYWIAAAADRVVVPQHGYSGNVGAIALHMDISKMLDAGGITVTTVKFGAEKADGFPTTPMTDDARARLQADIDAIGTAFCAAVARYRSLDAKAVRDTEAHAYLGADGVAAGLADAVMSPMEAFAALLDDVRAAA